MPSDEQILREIDAAFGEIERPEHFANFQHCRECADHDRLLLSRDRESLTVDDVGNPGWDPLCFTSAQGMAYYMPALARLALCPPEKEYEWYGPQLIFHLGADKRGNALYNYASPAQRAAVASLIGHIIESRAHLIQDYRIDDAYLQCYELWHDI